MSTDIRSILVISWDSDVLFTVPNYLKGPLVSVQSLQASDHHLRNSYYLSFLWLVIVLSHDLLLSQVSRLVTWCTVKRGPLKSLAGAQQGRQSTPSCGDQSFDHSLTGGGTTDAAASIDFYFAMLYLMLRLRSLGCATRFSLPAFGSETWVRRCSGCRYDARKVHLLVWLIRNN